MIDLTIKKKMLEILASMKGKTLKSIEGEYLYKWHRFSEIVRFNLGQFAVEIHTDYIPVKWFWNSDEIVDDEATCFIVIKEDLKRHNYPEGWQIVQFLKDEKISEVIIVRDSIHNNHGDDISFDSGFIIRTSENVYSFSMRYLGDISIHMNESDKIDMYYSVKKAREDCSEPESNLKATVKRDYIFL